MIFEAFLNGLYKVILVSWKGVFGEFLVNRLLSKLPESDYTLIKDVTLQTDDGTTQIDHIVVSKYGIFVVETKNMKGWIFGSDRQKQWTQKIYRHSSKFQNPLHQNLKHIKTLDTLLDCGEEHLHSIIVFIGDSTFKTEMPSNVTHARGCIPYIKEFNEVMFSDEDCSRLVESINHRKLKPGVITDIKHRKHVKEVVAAKAPLNQCKSNPQSRGDAIVSRYSLNKKIYKLFQSATQHTKQNKKIPAIFILVLFLMSSSFLYLGWFGYTMDDRLEDMTGGYYINTDEGMATNEDEKVREIVAVPQIVACLSNANKCQCYTQQWTRHETTEEFCLNYVSGNYFDPYRADK